MSSSFLQPQGNWASGVEFFLGGREPGSSLLATRPLANGRVQARLPFAFLEGVMFIH